MTERQTNRSTRGRYLNEKLFFLVAIGTTALTALVVRHLLFTPFFNGTHDFSAV